MKPSLHRRTTKKIGNNLLHNFEHSYDQIRILNIKLVLKRLPEFYGVPVIFLPNLLPF